MAEINGVDGTTDKKIEALEKKIQELEKKLNQSNQMFGRSYSQVGNSDQDFLIKTRGQIKIQYGNKFIDLIKDGKLNCDSKSIFSVKSKDDIKKDGIYLVNGTEVYLKIGSEPEFPIISNDGELFVSYESQETTGEQKQQALINLGLVCENSNNIPDIKNGFVYVSNDDKLYIINNGIAKQFVSEFPNPLLVQLVIDQKGTKQGSLVLQGIGKQNGLKFGNSWLYDDNGIVLDTNSKIEFIVNSKSGLTVYNYGIKTGLVELESINSNNFKIDSLGNIYCEKVYERNPNISDYSDKYIYFKKQRIKYVETLEDNTYYITLDNNSIFKNEDQIIILNNDSEYTGTIVKTSTEDDSLNSDEIYIKFDQEDVSNLVGKYIYLKIRESQEALIIDNNSLYLGNNLLLGYDDNVFKAQYPQNYNLSIDDSSNKFASTEWVNNKFTEHKSINIIDPDNQQLGYFDNTENLEITLPSTNWVNQQISDISESFNNQFTNITSKLLPIGSIIMYNGTSEIPDDWHICDGTNGTPNLIGKFIKASDTSGIEGGNSELVLKESNLPSHTHYFYNYMLGMHTTDEIKKGEHEVDGRTVIVGFTDHEFTKRAQTADHNGNTPYVYQQTQTTGDGQKISIEPQYYTLIYIMKIK